MRLLEDRTKRKFADGEFDLHKEYKTKEEAQEVAKELRKAGDLAVRVLRDFWWKKTPIYCVYTKPYEKTLSSINYFDNLFEKPTKRKK
mgnify:FL=1|jgi:hypothetical protein